MKEIVYVTHNKGKMEQAQRLLTDVHLEILKYDLEEPRSDDVAYISKQKVQEAYKLVQKPCISLDSGFWIEALNGFPKAFVNFSLETIGIEGILKLMEGKENRSCHFLECLSYYDGNNFKQFFGKDEGTLSKNILGDNQKAKWSDLWYIYIPYGANKTLAQMTQEERDARSKEHSTNAMQEFAKWYKEGK